MSYSLWTTGHPMLWIWPMMKARQFPIGQLLQYGIYETTISLLLHISVLSGPHGTLTVQDTSRLQPKEWANDTIITWYIKCVSQHFSPIQDSWSGRYSLEHAYAKYPNLKVHIFETFFYVKWREWVGVSSTYYPLMYVFRNPSAVILWKPADLFTLDYLVFPIHFR